MISELRSISSVACNVALLVALVPGLSWANCTGDCDGRGGVSIDELLMGVSIALDGARMDECPSMDVNGDETVTVDEVVLALGDALPQRRHTSMPRARSAAASAWFFTST